MKISEFAVKNHQFTIVVFLMLIAMGIYALIHIPQAEDPDLPMPIVPTTIVYPGASPIDMEELVVDPLEKAFKELDDVKRIWSDMKDGLASVVVEFESNSNPDKKFDEVQRTLQEARSLLPEDLLMVESYKINASETNIIQSALVSETASYAELGRLADNLQESISQLPGVKKAYAIAFPAQEIQINLDIGKLAQLKIPLNQVIGAIQSENTNIPAGSLNFGSRKFNIKTDGNYHSLNEIENTIIGGGDGNLVRLKDVADIDWGYEEPRYLGRYNGKKAVFITANMMEGFKIHDVRDRIYTLYADYESSLPDYITLERGFDQAKNVKKKLNRLLRDFLFAIILVMITLLPLGLRASGVVMIAIPLSLLIGFTGLYLVGFSINQLSIVGAVIALGLLVDDSIVVVENISRWIRDGHKPYEAAIKGTKQIGAAVIGCTATLLFAFLPLMFLPGLPGKYIRVLPFTIAFVVLGSLFVALTIIPFITSRFFKHGVNPEGNLILRIMQKVIDFTYGRALVWVLKNPIKSVLAASLLFFSSLFLIPIIGFSLFPKAGMQQFLITVETPRGSSLSETNKAVRFVESVVEKQSEIKYFMSNIGRGNPKVYYNVFQKGEQSNIGELLCEMTLEKQKEMTLFLDHLRDTLNTWPGARILVTEFENGSVITPPIALRLVGNDLNQLEFWSGRIDSIMKVSPGTQNIRNPLSETLTDLKLNVNSEKAGMLGVPGVEIDRTVRLALSGWEAGNFRDSEGKEFPIKLRLPKEKYPALSILDEIYVSSITGAQIPLSQLAKVEFTSSPTTIEHYNQTRYNLLSCYVKSSYNTDQVTKDILAEIDQLDMPEELLIIPSGEIESRQESFGGVGSAILIAIFSIFSILILEFKTFKSTSIVLSVIPLGIMGGLATLYITGNTLSFAAAVGFVALIGIEIKNSILLVDFTNQLREEGMPLDEAILKAGEIRFVPVVLTALTAIGGLLPVALGQSNLYSPLAWVIIGGLITSTLLSRLITPVMYKLLPPTVGNQQL